MKYQGLKIGHGEYKSPELTIMTLETESGMVLCASTDLEIIPGLDPDLEF
jgi:hypothetical protein